MAGRKGKTVRETVTEYPAPDIGQIPVEEEAEQAEPSEIAPEADEFIAMLENIPGAASLKAQVFRVLDAGGEKWLGTLTARDCNISAPQETIRARFGGGKFTVRAQHPGSGELIETTFDIEGPPKGEGPPSPFSIHLPSNGKNGDVDAIANMFAVVMDMNNKMILQMQENQRESTKVLVAALSSKPAGSGPTLEEILKFKALFAENEGASAKRLEQWITLGSLIIEKVSQFVIPQSDNPWVTALSQFGPKIGETAAAVLSNIAGKRGLVPPGQQPAQQAQTGPGGAPTGPVAASTVPQLTPQQLEQAKQYFESSILPDWMDAADRDEDPYSTKRNVRQLVGEDTRIVWQFLGLNGPDEFYAKYPKTAQYRRWFDDLFEFLNNPSKTPEDIENNHGEQNATVEYVG